MQQIDPFSIALYERGGISQSNSDFVAEWKLQSFSWMGEIIDLADFFLWNTTFPEPC